MKKIKSIFILIFILNIVGLSTKSYAQVVDSDEMIEVENDYRVKEVKKDYGMKDAEIQTHVYLNSALYNFEKDYLGKYANEGGSTSGRPLFINYSAYISLSAYISTTLYAEAEFELYKGQKGQVKVTRVRGVWTPNDYFKLTLGRDFPAIGLQDKVYYITSQYRMFAMAPYAYYQILRATGWWDAGIHMAGTIPFGKRSKLFVNMSIINGPGDQHKGEHFLEGKMMPNEQGYMFENFHRNARQPWDNNSSKHIATRLSFSPIENMEFGGSYMFGKYDVDDKYNADYLFGHFLYGGDRLTIAAEYAQLMIQVPDSNFYGDNGMFTDVDGVSFENKNALDNSVTQYSMYISAGYKFFQDTRIHYLEPVIRYEFMDSWKEDEMNRGDRNAIWAGVRFSPIKHWVIKAAYLYQTEKYKSLDNNGFVIETVFDF